MPERLINEFAWHTGEERIKTMIAEKEIMREWGISEGNPLVCIKCLAYNHEKYIAECLDKLLAQKTTFPFQIVVHDDCSTDGTTDIIKKYERLFPHIIKAIYETENQFSKQDGSLNRVIAPMLTGKYIAFCEGDDLWIDETKLQRQIEVLEKNSNCMLVLSDGYAGKEITYNTNNLINPYGINEDGYIDIPTVFISKNGLVPTCSMVCRSSAYFSIPDFWEKSPVGDKPIRMWCAVKGDVYYFATPFVFYRLNSGIDSFGQRARNKQYAYDVYVRFCSFLTRFDEYTEYKYSDLIQFMKEKEEYIYLGRVHDYKALLHCEYLKSKYVDYSVISKLKLLFKAYAPHLYALIKQ